MSSRIEFKNYVITSDGNSVEVATTGDDQRIAIDHTDVIAVTNVMQTLKRLAD